MRPRRYLPGSRLSRGSRTLAWCRSSGCSAAQCPSVRAVRSAPLHGVHDASDESVIVVFSVHEREDYARDIRLRCRLNHLDTVTIHQVPKGPLSPIKDRADQINRQVIVEYAVAGEPGEGICDGELADSGRAVNEDKSHEGRLANIRDARSGRYVPSTRVGPSVR